MGKKDNKKKGKGAEKTAAKTEKRTEQKIKKGLKAKGEDDIDTLLAEFAAADRRQQEVVVELCKGPPSKRSAFTLTPHPDKNKLIMLGGEHFNGTEAVVYNDMFIYTMKQDRWHRITCPGGPPPRCSHQAVAVSQNGGELWVFGGEFTSKSQSQFYHYKDLWVFSLATNKHKWRKITATGGPCGRSGHRMVASGRRLLVFGGFHDNGRDYKYYNDVFAFCLDTHTWTQLSVTGTPPAPRSACGLAALSDGRLLVYGGYSRRKVQGRKEDVGVTLTDMFYLVPEKQRTAPTGPAASAAKTPAQPRYKWVTVKQGGDTPNPSRCSFAFTACSIDSSGGAGGDKALLFGGVNDEDDNDDEEDDDAEVQGQFFDELFMLDMVRGTWTELHVTGKKDTQEEKKKRRRRKEGSPVDGEEEEEEEEEDGDEKKQKIDEGCEAAAAQAEETTVVTDGVFTLSMSCSSSTPASVVPEENLLGAGLVNRARSGGGAGVFVPPPRISAAAAVQRGVFYLYGGLYEEGDKQLTLNDFYSLELSKLEEWQTIRPLNRKDLEWFDSEDEEDSDDEDEEDEKGEEEDDDQMETNSD